MLENLYYYRARLIRVVDGDTIEASLDMGFKTWKKTTLRLAGINCPELKGESRSQGINARLFVQENLPDEFVVESNSVDDFGRAIADIWFKFNGEWVNLSSLLVLNQLAELKKY